VAPITATDRGRKIDSNPGCRDGAASFYVSGLGLSVGASLTDLPLAYADADSFFITSSAKNATLFTAHLSHHGTVSPTRL
jgi:hypothetical protein